MGTTVLKRRFNVEEYHRMVTAGILREDDRVELLEGEVVQMSPIGNAHAVCVGRLNRWFVERLGRRVFVNVQSPIELDDESEPQPDVLVLCPHRNDYAQGTPNAKDAYLVVEVSDTTQSYDRGRKIPAYARAGIPEVWLWDVPAKIVEVHRRPEGALYADVQRFTASQSIAPLAFPDCALPVGEIYSGL